MDNKWADMFWDNRNRQQEHPEEIDDEQLYCLYNLLILYHIQNDELLDTIIRIKDEETLLYEELTSFFGKNEKTEVKDVIKSVIERLQKAGNFPLTWFERLNLLSPGFFKFAYNKLNTLTSYCKKFNEMQLYIGESDSEKHPGPTNYVCAKALSAEHSHYYMLCWHTRKAKPSCLIG